MQMEAGLSTSIIRFQPAFLSSPIFRAPAQGKARQNFIHEKPIRSWGQAQRHKQQAVAIEN